MAVRIYRPTSPGTRFKTEIKREGHVYFQEYRRGVPVGPLQVIGETDKTGTKQTFKPDPLIFTSVDYSYDILASRLRELSFLNAGFVITLTDERGEGRTETGGIGGCIGTALGPSSAPVSSTGQALRAPSPRYAGRRN